MSKTKKLKLLCLLLFIGLAIVGLTNNKHFAPTAKAFSSGPPPSVSGAPGEATCTACHTSGTQTGQFQIVAPPNYTPGQTYQISVQHTTNDTTRMRWGFQLTALDGGNSAAGTFANLDPNTQTDTGMERFYIGHTSTGTFAGQTGGTSWTFNWTAPATDVGPVTFYAAGNQANKDGNTTGDQIYQTNVAVPPVAQEPNKAFVDLDGDGKTDISIFRPAPGEWWYLRSSDGGNAAFQFGQSSDTIVPADYTGDGKDDIAFFRPSSGEWFVLRSEDSSFYSFPFGTSGDIPVPGDYDGDGTADPAVFRPSSATWFISNSGGGTTIQPFGLFGDDPVAKDYDGDGKDDIAIFRPSVGEWYYERSSDQQVFGFQFGTSSDRAVPSDYTGDGKADIGFWRPSSGEWFILRSEDSSFFAFPFGSNGDIPVPGDYDGDATADAAVFRPSNNIWFLNQSTNGSAAIQFGITNDIPLPSAYTP